MAGIKALMEKLEADAAFAGEIIKAGSVEERMDKIRQAGFEITPEELAKAQKSDDGDENSALREDELKAVTGGTNSDEYVEMIVEMNRVIDEFKNNFPGLDVSNPVIQRMLTDNLNRIF